MTDLNRREFCCGATGGLIAGLLPAGPLNGAERSAASPQNAIWDLHCHFSGVTGKSVEDRTAQILEYADRMNIERLVFFMGWPWSQDPDPDDFRRQNDQVLSVLKRWPDRLLGFAYLNQQPIVALSRSRLEWLRDETGVSTHLSELQGIEVLYLETHQAKSAFVSSTSTGTRASAYASPVGWCLLASHSDEEIDKLFKEVIFEARTDFTPMSCAELKERVHQAREDGHVFSKGWYDTGGSTLATPVRNHDGRIVGCIDLSGPDSGFDPAKVETIYLPNLLVAAAKISAELGFQG